MAHDSPKRVLYIHANNTDVGGADFCMYKMARELDPARYEPVVLLGMKTAVVELYEKSDIPVFAIPMKRLKRTKNPLFFMKFGLAFLPTVIRIRRLIKRERIDLVHANDFQDIYGPFAARLAGLPSIQHIRLIMVSPKPVRAILSSIIHAMNDQILCVSKGTARYMFRRYLANGRKVTVYHDWLDMESVGHRAQATDIREEYGIPKDAPLIGIVGRLEEWKGQHIFIQAAAEVARRFPEARFLVVGGIVEGRGREFFQDWLKQMAEESGIAKHTVFTGYRTDIYHIVKSLDVFVHASITPDPLPGTVMEAMYLERPVVAAKDGGVPEEIGENGAGVLYEPGNIPEMADAICGLIEDPEGRRRMGRLARSRVEGLFNIKVLRQQLLAFYDEVLRNG